MILLRPKGIRKILPLPLASLLPLAQQHQKQRPFLVVVKQLSKARLSSMVAMSTIYGSLMNDEVVNNVPLIIGGASGVFLASAGASAINQIVERSIDLEMPRTSQRPLPTKIVKSSTALLFSSLMLTSSLSLMFISSCSTISMALTMFNFFLYSFVYTILKRFTQWNTAIGAIVGAIPPIIGYLLVAGEHSTTATTITTPILLGGILFFWQFPHFHSLSWRYKDSYCRTGYLMRSVLSPQKAKNSSVISSICLGICTFLTVPMGICPSNPVYLTALIFLNGTLLWFSREFYSSPIGDTLAALKLFRYTLIYLPLIIILMSLFRG